MKPPDDAALREAIRIRMSPPNRESVTEIPRNIGNTSQTRLNWRGHWQKQGLLVPATTRPPEQWVAADKLAVALMGRKLCVARPVGGSGRGTDGVQLHRCDQNIHHEVYTP
jgi:hypothetical protein